MVESEILANITYCGEEGYWLTIIITLLLDWFFGDSVMAWAGIFEWKEVIMEKLICRERSHRWNRRYG